VALVILLSSAHPDALIPVVRFPLAVLISFIRSAPGPLGQHHVASGAVAIRSGPGRRAIVVWSRPQKLESGAGDSEQPVASVVVRR